MQEVRSSILLISTIISKITTQFIGCVVILYLYVFLMAVLFPLFSGGNAGR
jgi:hypothetical protein